MLEYIPIALNSCCLLLVITKNKKQILLLSWCPSSLYIYEIQPVQRISHLPAVLFIFQDPGYSLLKKLIGESGAKVCLLPCYH